MIIVKNQFIQHLLTAVTLVLVLGALSMIWPMILAIFLWILGLFQSISTKPAVAVLFWDEVGSISVVLNGFRHPGLPSVFL
jgi:hypothetical protein